MQNYTKLVKQMLHDNNILNPPVDVFSIISRNRIKLISIPLDDNVSGVLDMRNTKSPKIILNDLHHINRKRFSAAHELGHYIMHVKTGIHMDKNSFFRNQKSSSGLHSSEIEANKFAAELLMPKDYLIESLSYYNDLIDNDIDIIEALAKEYLVSTTAMAIRSNTILDELGFFSL